MAPAPLTWPAVIGRRLARSRLTSPAASVVDAVREAGPLQAQVLSAAALGACIRTRDAVLADVDRALYEERTLVKTWSIRGTLHLVASDELALWSSATRHDDVDERILDALAGRALTRQELADEVGDERLRSGWGELLQPLARSGLICFGHGVTFVRVEDWLGPQRAVDAAAARAEILRRYLHVHGPAKPGDFRRWSGWDGDFSELEPVRVEGTRAFVLAGDTDFDVDPRSLVLLPQYDAYVIGFRPREPLLPQAVKERVAADPKGRFESVTGMSPVLVDGVVAGFWRRDGAVDLVTALPRGRKRELDAALRRVRALLG